MILGTDEALPSYADVCIVGAGPAGLALAFKCASEGLAVTVLEGGGGKEDGVRTDAAPHLNGDHHADSSLIAWRGIGGTSRLWGGRCVAFDDIDFEQRAHVAHSGWPIPHSDVARYYDEALEFLGCGKGGMEPAAWPNESEADVSTSTIEIWSREPDLARFHGDQLRSAKHIRICVGCMAREIVLDPEGMRVTTISVQRGSSVAEVRAGAFVLAGGGMENARLLLAAQRYWPRKFGGSEGPLGRFYTGHLTGYLAKVHFYHGRFAETLAYRRSADGAYFRQRLSLAPEMQRREALLNTAFWLDSFSISDPGHGSGALSLAYLSLSSLGLYRRMRRGLAPSFAGMKPAAQQMHWSNVRSDPELAGSSVRVLQDFVRNRFANRVYALVNPKNRYLLRYHAEHAPNEVNRVRLSDDGDNGSARLSVDYRFLPSDIDSVVRSHELLDAWLRKNDVGCLDYLSEPARREEQVFNQALDGYHQIGLTRMSDSPSEGVVDGNCQVHDLSNLFIAGTSVFPTSGQANPTLLAVALAKRLANHLARVRLGS